MSMVKRVLFLGLALVAEAVLAQVQPAPFSQGGNRELLRPEAEQLFARANEARGAAGAAPLRWDPALAAAARPKAPGGPP